MNEALVLTERHGAVAVVKLNRPDKHNALNRALQNALGTAVLEFEADDSINAIIITGGGDKAFCAGADMGEVLDRGTLTGAPPPPPDPNAPRPVDGVGSVVRAQKPIIGAINGYAYGLGAQLATICDIRICSDQARFRFVGASYGLVVSGSDLPRLVGPAIAKELLFTARVVEAEEALRIGLANKVVPHDSLMDAALEMGQMIAANSPGAVRWAKKVVDASTTVAQGRETEIEAGRALRGTDDNSTRFRAAAERVTGRAGG